MWLVHYQGCRDTSQLLTHRIHKKPPAGFPKTWVRIRKFLPAPSSTFLSGCQLNHKGWWIDTLLETTWHPLEGPGMRIDENCFSHSLIILFYTWQLCATIPVWIYPGLRESSFSFVSRKNQPNDKSRSQVDLKHCWIQVPNFVVTMRFWWFILVSSCSGKYIPDIVVKILFIGSFRERLNHQPPNHKWIIDLVGVPGSSSSNTSRGHYGLQFKFHCDAFRECMHPCVFNLCVGSPF